MRFRQIDQITLLEPGKRIEAFKTLRGDEDYLRDHFPRFPVMPGVLMLESLYQAAALLVRATEGFQSGLILLREAKNVKFADFVQPGQTFRVTAEILKQDGDRYALKAIGVKAAGASELALDPQAADTTAVSARLVLERMPGANGQPEIIDRLAANYMKHLTEQLQGAAIASG